MTLDEIKKLVADLNAAGIPVTLSIPLTLDAAPSRPPAEELPDPDPQEETVLAVVAVDKTLARFAASRNAKGRPVMAIYPADNAPAAQRVKYLFGDTLLVQPDVVTADGGGLYYRLAKLAPDGKTALYVIKGDVDIDE